MQSISILSGCDGENYGPLSPGVVDGGKGAGRAMGLQCGPPAYKSHFITVGNLAPIFSAQPSSCHRNNTSCHPTSPQRETGHVDGAVDDPASDSSDTGAEEEPPLTLLQLAELAKRCPVAMVTTIMAQAVEVCICQWLNLSPPIQTALTEAAVASLG